MDLRITPLEPRLVLNATAELSALGQLLIDGTPDADFVRLESDANGDLTLLDDQGDPIAIDNHPDGPGNETNPLDRSVVSEIAIDLGAGNDVLDLQLPRGIDVSVAPDTSGFDEVRLDFVEFDPTQITATSVIDVAADQIELQTQTGVIAFADATVRFSGSTRLGETLAPTQLDVTRAMLDWRGVIAFDGDVSLIGDGRIDWSQAIASANRSGINVSVDLAGGASSSFLLGGADDAGGSLINDLTIASVDQVVLGPSSIRLDGELTVQQVSDVSLESSLEADRVEIDASSIDILDRLAASDGEISLSAGSTIELAGSVETFEDHGIELNATSIRLIDALLDTSSGSIQISGVTIVDGLVEVDTRDDLGAIAGDIRIVDSVIAADSSDDVLEINARGTTSGGLVQFQAPVGSLSPIAGSLNLNGLFVDAAELELNGARVTSGNIELAADEIRLTKGEVQAFVTGNVLVDGPLTLPIGDTLISAASAVALTSPVRGQAGSQRLEVVAGGDATFGAEVTGIQQFDVLAQTEASFAGRIQVAGAFTVQQVSGAVMLQSSVEAGSVDIEAGSIDIRDRAVATSGGISLTADNAVELTGDLETTSNAIGPIELQATSVELTDTSLKTSSSSIQITGPAIIDGLVQLETRDAAGEVAGDVEFADSVIAADSSGDVLEVNARGTNSGGLVRFLAPVGSLSPIAGALDLNGLVVNAADLELDGARVTSGNIELAADEIRLTQGELQTSVSGDITVDGVLSLPTGDTLIDSAGAISFVGPVRGQVGSNRLEVVAGDDATFGAEVIGIQQFDVVAQTEVSFAGRVQVAGAFTVQQVSGAVTLESSVEAGSVDIDAGSIDIRDRVVANSGGISLTADNAIELTGDLLETTSNANGPIDLQATSVELTDTSLKTSSSSIQITGPTIIDGLVQLDTRDATGEVAGDVQFADSVIATDISGDILEVNARGTTSGGLVRFLAPVGSLSPIAGALDLNGLLVSAAELELDGARVTSGNIELAADEIRLTRGELQTSVSGDITVDGILSLPTGDTLVSAADGVLFAGPVRGQAGSNRLEVIAGDDARFESEVTGIQQLDVVAQTEANFAGRVQVAGAFTVQQVSGAVTLQSSVEAGSADIDAGSIDIQDRVVATSGGISLTADNTIELTGDLETTSNANGAINLQAALIELTDASLKTSSSSIQITGPTIIGGLVQIDTRDAAGEVAGDVEFADSVIAADSSGDILEVNAHGTTSGGLVQFRAPVGSLSPIAGALDLNGLFVNAAELELDGARVTSGNIELAADEIRLTRGELQTSVSGDITVDGILSLPTGDTLIDSAGAISFVGPVRGQAGSNRLEVVAGDDATFGAEVIGIQQLDVVAQTEANFAGRVQVAGAFAVQQVSGAVTLESSVEAGSVDIDAGSIDIRDRVVATSGGISLTADNAIELTGDLETTSNASGAINLQAASIEITDASLKTSSSSIQITGPTIIDGLVQLDTRDAAGEVAGDVQFVDSVIAADGTGDVLEVNALATTAGGLVRFLAPVGSLSPIAGALDLNGLFVNAAELELDGARVTSGNIELAADEIRLTRGELRTSVSGDITVDGILSLPTGDTLIDAAGAISFLGPVRGQAGSNRLEVTAGDDAQFESEVTGITELEVTAQAAANFEGRLSIGGDLTVDADSILINNAVDTTVGSVDGQVVLQGRTSVTLAGDETIQAGQNAILVDADGGVIDTTRTTLVSQSTGTAVSLRDASAVTLGNVNAIAGQVVIGVGQDVSGLVSQEVGTTVDVERLVISSTGQADLSNVGNDIRTVESVVTGGDFTLRDDLNNLVVLSIDPAGSNVSIIAVGTIELAPLAIVNGRNVQVIAGGDLVDRTDNEAFNIEADVVTLVAASIGANDNALEVLAQVELNADTSSVGGSMVLSNPIGDLPIGEVNAGAGDVRLTAGDDVRRTSDGSRLVADDLQVVAENVLSDADEAIDLITNVNDFQASVLGTNRGDIRIVEQDAIRLASSDDLDDEIVETANGQIIVLAGERISIVDHAPGDEGPDRKGDPELVARGTVGRIDLEVIGSGGEIELGQTVQLFAEKKTPNQGFGDPVSETSPADLILERSDRAVFIQADVVRFGTEIEIFTGEDQGTARVFAPRPIDLVPPGENQPFPDTDAVGDGASAFFVASSVRTDRLAQAPDNGALGTLSLDVGQEGERGLTIDIDWGAPAEPSIPGQPERFQRIDGLDSDRATFVDANGNIVESAMNPDARLSVQHVYSESDILLSDANGRPSSTDPLEVRFAVRHHASIFVSATEVQQGDAVNDLPGGVASTTDNPNTDPLLENGRATFIIPSLTIPVEFFPVREVIPEIETTEVVVQRETIVEFNRTNLDVVDAVIVPAVGREEYFQIRALSADPNGEDLATQRLPDDILTGNKIKNLLSRLPDGRYEIEYVLGDTTRRTLLRVDVRGGEATVPGESLDEGILRLKEISSEELDSRVYPELPDADDDQAEKDVPSKRNQALPEDGSSNERSTRSDDSDATSNPTSGTPNPTNDNSDRSTDVEPGASQNDQPSRRSDDDSVFHLERSSPMHGAAPLVGTCALASVYSRRRGRSFSRASALAKRRQSRAN